MTLPPSIFDTCQPRPEVLAGYLPDTIFAADLWDVITRTAHEDYSNPEKFFAGTHPTENLKFLVREVAERLAGEQGGVPIFRLETGFGGGKTHALIACVHVAREGNHLSAALTDYQIRHFPVPGDVRVAAFVGEDADPLSGVELEVEGQRVRTYTPWGQIALMAGGLEGYARIRENDLQGTAPSRGDMEAALGTKPVLILLDELVLYMARAYAIGADQPRAQVNTQWPTFLQTLFSIAARRPATVVLLTLPSEQDANRRQTAELKQHLASILESSDEQNAAVARQARNLTPTQATERAAVLGRRLFTSVDSACAGDVARQFAEYYNDQRDAGVPLDNRALEADYAEQIRLGYPFHPELIRLFADRLAGIPEFQATRGALRLVARLIRSAWDRRNELGHILLLQPHHLDMTRADIREEVLARLGRAAFERGLDTDVISQAGGAHAGLVEAGWPWKAATESSLAVFFHSLPDGSRGLTAAEAAIAAGRPGCDLGYVQRGLDESERRAWFMRREGDHFIFRTRASVRKRQQERLSQLQSAELREELDRWIQEVYSGFEAFQVIPFPQDHTAIPDTADRVRLAIVHYDKERGTVGAGDRLSFTRDLFTKTGVNASPRNYKNNLIFLLVESTRVDGLQDAVRALIAWTRVLDDIRLEMRNLAQAANRDLRTLQEMHRRGQTGVPAEFIALAGDEEDVRQKLGEQELNVRTRLVEAYRVLAFPRPGGQDNFDLFAGGGTGSLLECYRVDFGEDPNAAGAARRQSRQAVAEAPILQCLRQNNKLVPEPAADNPQVLAPQIVRSAPLWRSGESRLATEEVWDRLRRESDLPMLLRPADLLPTLRAGVTAEPEPLWVYYNAVEKRVYDRSNSGALVPVLAPGHYLYDPVAAFTDRIFPVASVHPQEVWDYLWPREGADRVESLATSRLLTLVKESARFPVMPERTILWQTLQEGARTNFWILYLRGPGLAIGPQEIVEWPGTPLFEDGVELWSYQAALDRGLYPRVRPGGGDGGGEQQECTAALMKARCWPGGRFEISSEELERGARAVWQDLSRGQMDAKLREGLTYGIWAAWKQGAEETFYLPEDLPVPDVRVSPEWLLVELGSLRATELDPLRPGRGPQPVTHVGTPREALTAVWDDMARFPGVQVSELKFAVMSREAFDNTLRATWADRPTNALADVSVIANGQRETAGRRETVSLHYEGRFEEVSSMLGPIWPFQSQGELEVTIEVRLRFDSAVALTDSAIVTYRTALMNANQGQIQVTLTPQRARRREE